MANDVPKAARLRPSAPRGVGPAVIIGSALEWFDFYLYASMAALVFGDVFFPGGDPAAATMAAVATFAVGFLARPLGGVVFGALGDRIGRKRVLSLTFLLMGVSSAGIGLLPTYEAVGIAAPILLVVLRLLQGLGAGAEFGGAIAVAYEHAAPGRRGRQGAWPALGVNLGLLLSSLTVAALTSTDKEFLNGFGWRIPFLLSFALIGVGVWVRRRLPETPEFEAVVRTGHRRAPLRELVRGNWRALLVVMVITIGYNGVSYIFKTFSLAYLTNYRDVPANVGALGISIASFFAIITVPIAGRLADRLSAKAVVLTGGVATVALAFPFFWLLDTGNPWLIWTGLVCATGIVVPAMLAAQGAFLAQQFPAEVRSSGLGTGREVGGAFAGGLAPLAALALVQSTPGHGSWAVSLLFVAGGLFIVLGTHHDQSRRRNRARAEAPVAVS
ncbi:MFS transporter [Amycolatopsis albispora]|uniref:MFS transporter n=1 Tax=Amycolatopsis albispora TaxID=1804986 RepID=A0A344L396_9PSEU|nr:MFS transporter [Amycolatopsis albispora]AXB42520.1 MFS transporter [Amycolatopsis albispora]